MDKPGAGEARQLAPAAPAAKSAKPAAAAEKDARLPPIVKTRVGSASSVLMKSKASEPAESADSDKSASKAPTTSERPSSKW